jgi:hypothetical protein
MPCYTIQTVNVNLGKVDLDLLQKALEALFPGTVRRVENLLIRFGNGESYSRERGELSLRKQETAALIKRAYSAEVVKSQAKKFGWQLKETAPFQFTVTKR